jgi:hypothetical protein
MPTGLWRLLAAWSAFGVFLTIDVVTTVTNKRSSPVHSLLDCGGLGTLTWALIEGYLGPRARDRQERRHSRMDTREAADVMAGAVGESLRAENDKDGERVRRCS